MITCTKKRISKLQYCTDGGNILPTNFAIFNEGSLDSLLDSLNVKTTFYNNEIKCEVCGEVISKNNLRSIIPSETKIVTLCTKPQCIDEYHYTYE